MLLSFTQLKSSSLLDLFMRCICKNEATPVDWGIDPLTKQEWVTFYCEVCDQEFTRWIVQW